MSSADDGGRASTAARSLASIEPGAMSSSPSAGTTRPRLAVV
jgi:hypothetical protein